MCVCTVHTMTVRYQPLSLYCSPLMALTVKVWESSSLGEMTAPARGSVPRGFCGRDCSLTKYSSTPASLFNTKNLQGRNERGRADVLLLHLLLMEIANILRPTYIHEQTSTSGPATHLYCHPVTRLVYFIK